MKKDEINAIIAYIENTLMENLRTNNDESIDGLLNIIHGYDKLKMLAEMEDLETAEVNRDEDNN